MKPEELSIVELKSEVYDRLAMIEKCQQEVRILNEWVAKKSQEPVTTPAEVKPTVQ